MSDAHTAKTLQCSGGNGPAVLLIHGFGADRFSWLGNTADLQQGTTVYTVELPGHGNAWDVAVTRGLDTLCEQIVLPAITEVIAATAATATVNATVNTTAQVHLVGHSLGGALAMIAAASDPARIASLSLIAPLGLGAGANVDFIQQFTNLDDEASATDLLQKMVFNPRLISAQLIKPLLTHIRKTGVRKTLKTLASDVLDPGQVLQTAVDQLCNSNLPRQVFWGMDDTINTFSPDDQTRFGGDWHKMNNCGHLPHIEQRIESNRQLLDFVIRADKRLK